ncbi:MAG: dienelactone hydrolase family protein [Saprospiraceae bacterium]|nr:MAG: dienelactone hydrolase family protein [Saprospiraceae bacterium]
MTHKFTLAFFILTAMAFTRCTNAPGGEQQSHQGDSMAKFTSDSNFAKAHETPENIAFQGRGEMTEFPTSDGRTGKAYLVKPSAPANKFLFLLHEWWGLNDQIKREAERLADSLGNVTVMALDLYDGNATSDAGKAGELMNAVKPERCNAIINGALAVAGPDARIATVGWCFGGGWSLRSSILAAGRGAGCVMYYGLPVEKANELALLQADVLGIFAKKDDWINEGVVGKFEALAKATGKNLEVHWYDAAHAFANPSSPRYNEVAAQEANKLALDFLRQHLED